MLINMMHVVAELAVQSCSVWAQTVQTWCLFIVPANT